MGKPTLQQAAAVIDPMLSDNFQLAIPNTPTGDGTPLLIHCQQATKPGVTLENVEVMLFGHTFEHVGRATYSHDMSVTYVENRNGQIQVLLEDWATYCRDKNTQHGHYKAEYVRDAVLTIFDQAGKAVREYKIKNVWPNTIPEVQFDGSAANLITLGVTFKYDWVERTI